MKVIIPEHSTFHLSEDFSFCALVLIYLYFLVLTKCLFCLEQASLFNTIFNRFSHESYPNTVNIII